jgi:ribose 5-phosphate isomerase A
MKPKERAAAAAIAFVQSGMVVGLGTGTTANCFLHALADAIHSGRLQEIRGIPTSSHSQRRAQDLGIPLTTLAQCPHPDMTVDGADEIDPNLDLIKGLGGALLREKIVAQNSQRLIIIADITKQVDRLGSHSPLPVEVAQFGHEAHAPFFASLGAKPTLRRTQQGNIYITDNGNFIYDLKFPTPFDPRAIENAILHRAGVVDCGLFLQIAQIALIADDNAVREMRR